MAKLMMKALLLLSLVAFLPLQVQGKAKAMPRFTCVYCLCYRYCRIALPHRAFKVTCHNTCYEGPLCSTACGSASRMTLDMMAGAADPVGMGMAVAAGGGNPVKGKGTETGEASSP